MAMNQCANMAIIAARGNSKAYRNAFALTGRDCSNTGDPGCRFACPGLGAPLGFQPVLANTTYCTTVGNEVVFRSYNGLSITSIEMATIILASAA